MPTDTDARPDTVDTVTDVADTDTADAATPDVEDPPGAAEPAADPEPDVEPAAPDDTDTPLVGATDDDTAPSHSPDAEAAEATGLSEWQIRGLRSLRAPSRPDELGYKPTVWCKACTDAAKAQRGNTCQAHARKTCRTCGNHITEAHHDLSYMGHAAVTRRLIIADPSWDWTPTARALTEPLATLIREAIHAGMPDLAKDLLLSAPPAYVEDGLWIKLTVCGVTREGFGDAQGKRGPNAVKEVIGDAIRNAAMRFGCGLDLWHKGQFVEEAAFDPATRTAPADGARAPHAEPPARAAQQAESGTNAAPAGDAAPQPENGQPAAAGGMDVEVVVDTLAGVRNRTSWTALRKSADAAGILDRTVKWGDADMTLAEAFDDRARQLAARS